MYADSSRLTLFSFFTVARDRPGETSEAEGSMGAPVLQYDVSFPHCSLHLPLLMNRYFSRNWRKVANKSISSEHLMTFSLTPILLAFKQSTLTKPSSAHARGETLSGLRGPPHRTAYLLSPRKFQFFNLISFILPFVCLLIEETSICLITRPSFHFFFRFCSRSTYQGSVNIAVVIHIHLSTILVSPFLCAFSYLIISIWKYISP